MAVNIANKQIGEVSVVALNGRIVLGEESNSLRERVKALIGEGKKKIVLNMTKRHVYRQCRIGHSGSCTRQCQKTGRFAAFIKFGK